jgi:hypothetical protein
MVWDQPVSFPPRNDCAICSGFTVRIGADSLCDLLRIHCANCPGFCTKCMENLMDEITLVRTHTTACVGQQTCKLDEMSILRTTALIKCFAITSTTRNVFKNHLRGISTKYMTKSFCGGFIIPSRFCHSTSNARSSSISSVNLVISPCKASEIYSILVQCSAQDRSSYFSIKNHFPAEIIYIRTCYMP